MKKVIEGFNEIEDIRDQSYTKHKLSDVLILIMCGVLCGLDNLEDIVDYGKNKLEFLSTNFNIKKIPSKATLSRILNMINADEVSNKIIEIMLENVGELGEIIAVDGKAIRRTSKKGVPHSALQILTAYCTESGVTLGQELIRKKTNEIPIFQEMLDTINIKNKIITADAMHCQNETCKKIIDKKGNYAIGLKKNQKTLFEDVELFISDKINSNDIEIDSISNKNNGRFEKRTCYKVNNIDWLEQKKQWAGLSCVFAIKREIETKHEKTEEISYYITSLKNSTPKELIKIVREHWKIESMHWILDVVFSEDDCAILSENGIKTLNSFRKFSLSIHKNYVSKLNKKIAFKRNMFDCLLNDESLLNVINVFFNS